MAQGHTAMKEKIESEISQWLTSEESTFKILKGIWLEIHCVYPLGLLNSADDDDDDDGDGDPDDHPDHLEWTSNHEAKGQQSRTAQTWH